MMSLSKVKVSELESQGLSSFDVPRTASVEVCEGHRIFRLNYLGHSGRLMTWRRGSDGAKVDFEQGSFRIHTMSVPNADDETVFKKLKSLRIDFSNKVPHAHKKNALSHFNVAINAVRKTLFATH